MHGGRRVSAVRRATRRLARLIGLFIVVLLVVGIGIGLNAPDPQAPSYSASEQAQLDAEERYRSLADDARTAAVVQPDLAERLTVLAADLEVQSMAVSLPRSPASTPAGTTSAGTTAHGGSPAAPTPDPSWIPPESVTTTAPPVDGMQVLSMLRSSALLSLRDAVNAEPGPGRVLAAAGTNQWRHTVLLAQALGVDPGLPPADSPSDAGPTGSGPNGSPSAPDAAPGAAATEAPAEGLDRPSGTGSGDSDVATDSGRAADPGPGAGAPAPGDAPNAAGTEECTGTPRGPEADRQALLNAKNAEDQARYGYEVAAALLEDRAGVLGVAVEHRAAADAAAERLAEFCVIAAPPPAGFAIGPAFRADPSLALRELEQDHVELYAGLVSAVSPGTRAWAVASLNAAVQRGTAAGTPLEPLPGLATGSSGTQTSAAAPDAVATPGAVPSSAAPAAR